VVGARAPPRRPPPLARQVEQKNVEAKIVPAGKTKSSVREVPLTGRALAALDAMTPRFDRTLLFPAPQAGRSTSTTSASASGRPPSSPPASERRRGSRKLGK